MVKQYTKKPVTIDAMIYTGSNASEIMTWLGVEHTFVTNGELVIPTLEDGADGQVKHVASVGDYIIRGVLGEFYPCKPDIFAMTYGPAQAQKSRSTFGEVLEGLNAGKRFRRTGWNGVGMFIFRVAASKFTVNRPPLTHAFVEGTEIEYASHIDICTAYNNVSVWTPSQADMSAEDWVELI